MKKIACLSVCIAFLIFFTAPVVSAQILDGQWFELKFKTKGLFIDNSDTVTSASYSIVAYLNLEWDNVAQAYDCVVRSKRGDSWGGSGSEDLRVSGTNEEIMAYWFASIWHSAGILDMFSLTLSTNFKIKKDSTGQFKSATISSLGCVAVGNFSGDGDFYGNCTIKGKSIDPSKLPFTP